MPVINITVKGKVASSDTKAIVNGNSDYTINWALDDEWADYDTKTMRVRFFDGSVIDSIFSGTSCSLPVITETCMIEIGLFAGDLITSTPAVINCIRCIRDDEGPIEDPPTSVYDQILAKLNELGGVSPDDVAPLTGTTAELTPSQVRDAVLAGRPVVVQYTDSEYGVLKFTNFNLAPSNSLIASVAIIQLSDAWVVYALYGYTLNQQWTQGITQMATGSDMNAIETSVDAVSARVATLEGAGYLTLDTLPKYGGESV